MLAAIKVNLDGNSTQWVLFSDILTKDGHSSSWDCNCKRHVMRRTSKRPGNFTAVCRTAKMARKNITSILPIARKEGKEGPWWNRYRCPWSWTSEFEFADVAVVAFVATKDLSAFPPSRIPIFCSFNPNKLRSVKVGEITFYRLTIGGDSPHLTFFL